MAKIRLLKDGDDTCWSCRHNYFIADWACGLVIARALGPFAPPPHEVLYLAKRIEKTAMAERGFRFTQFEDAWVETYRQLAEQCGRQYLSEVAASIFYEAAYVKRSDYPVFAETHQVLRQLRPMVESIHLVSLGDHDFQMKKVRRNGLESAFDSIHITQFDKRLVMQELTADGVQAVMVGDNLQTDIEPALALNLTAVWIHNTSLWAQSENHLDPRVQVIHHLRELPALIARLSGTT